MKKRYSFLTSIIIIVIVFALCGPVKDAVISFEEQQKIDDCKPTQQEMLEFQQLLNKNTYYYYNNLEDSQKEAYVTMYTSFISFDESFVMEIDATLIKEIFTAVLYDNPHIFWVNNNYQYSVNSNSVTFTPDYRNTVLETRTITAELNELVSNVMAYVNTIDSQFEKELYIHDYVCNNTVYDKAMANFGGDSAYDALLNGRAICEGYSRAIQLLLDAADIDNYLVVGEGISEGEAEPHMWNIVNIDDMNYHLDATWDDSGENNSIVYFYFNVNDEYIVQDHLNIDPAYNNCTSISANYFVMKNMYVDFYDGFNAHINRSIEEIKAGNNKVEFFFENSEDLNNAIDDIENDNGFFDFVYSVINKSGRELNPYEIEYYTINNHNYLCVVFKVISDY